jgi:hypothetical protein
VHYRPIVHPIHDPRESSICLITKDPQREYKDLLASNNVNFIQQVVGIEKLKGMSNMSNYNLPRLTGVPKVNGNPTKIAVASSKRTISFLLTTESFHCCQRCWVSSSLKRRSAYNLSLVSPPLFSRLWLPGIYLSQLTNHFVSL